MNLDGWTELALQGIAPSLYLSLSLPPSLPPSLRLVLGFIAVGVGAVCTPPLPEFQGKRQSDGVLRRAPMLASIAVPVSQ